MQITDQSGRPPISWNRIRRAVTEWPEFRGLDPRRLKQLMRQPRIVDLRNIFDPEELRSLGFAYEGVGRPQTTHTNCDKQTIG